MSTTADRVLETLQRYELTRDGPTEYRANSPLRPGANSHSFKLTLDDATGEKGAYYDHVSGERGSLYELAAALGIETGAAPVADTKRAYKDLDDYAAAHGVPGDVLRAAGWQDAAAYQGRPALAFKTRTGLRYRFLDGEKPPYKSVAGYQSSWYGLERALMLAEETWLPLVLCNGEISTVVGQHYRVPACCITGGGERGIPDGLLAELKARHDGPVLIAMDCDGKGRQAAATIHAQLPTASIVDLGLGDKGDLADFCALHRDEAGVALVHRQSATPAQETRAGEPALDTGPLAAAIQGLQAAMRQDAKLRRQADLDRLIADARAEIDRLSMATAKPQIVSFADLSTQNHRALEWALQHPDPVQGLRSRIPTLDKALGGFLPEVYVIYGATSMGKSWMCVSLVREFISQGPGLIVTTESDPRRWQIRLAASLTKIPADAIETGMLTPEQARDYRRSLDWLSTLKCHALANGAPTPAQVRAAVLSGLDSYGYKWVVVDSASKMAAPGTSNIYDRTTAVSDGLQSLYQEINLPVICTTQVGRDVAERGNKMPQLEDGYGGGVIEHNAGVVLGLYRHQYYVEKGTAQPSPEYPPTMTLARILKNRWRPGAQVNSVRLNFVAASGFYEMQGESA